MLRVGLEGRAEPLGSLDGLRGAGDELGNLALRGSARG
jgi:hypothetical protein